MTKKMIPKFASESEEAKWWYENRELHADQFVEAYKEGRVRTGGIAQRVKAAREASELPTAHEGGPKHLLKDTFEKQHKPL